MRRPIELEPWLSRKELRAWVQEAATVAQHRRRLAVWMASTRTLTAAQIGAALLVTRDAVGRWLRHYNDKGPEHFDGQGRGGRRRARRTLQQEQSLLRSLETHGSAGRLLTVPQIVAVLEARTGESWPRQTVYDLLHRHGWRRLEPRPRHARADPDAQRRFKKNSAASSPST